MYMANAPRIIKPIATPNPLAKPPNKLSQIIFLGLFKYRKYSPSLSFSIISESSFNRWFRLHIAFRMFFIINIIDIPANKNTPLKGA